MSEESQDERAETEAPDVVKNDAIGTEEEEAPPVTAKNVLEELSNFFDMKTQQGLFPLIAYGYTGETFYALTTTISDLPLGMRILGRAGFDYNVGFAISPSRLQKLAKQNPHVFRIHEQNINGLQNVDIRLIGRFAGIYGAPYIAQKGFGLVDICGFTTLDTAEQLSQLYSLTNVGGSSMRRCHRFCERLRLRTIFGKASTGDGFYIWHDYVGGHADVASLMIVLCMLSQAEAMHKTGFKMRLKASFVIDGAFMLYDSSGKRAYYQVAANAVGPATNGAARLVDVCRPGQLLMGDFSRPGQGDEMMTPGALIAQANELFREEGFGAGRLKIDPDKKLRVEDKHREVWYCWNVWGDVPNATGGSHDWVRIGVQPDESTDVVSLRFR